MSGLSGVKRVAVDLDRGLVDVDLAAGNSMTPAALRGAVRQCGFESRDIELRAIGRFVGASAFAIANTKVELHLAQPRAAPSGPVTIEGTLDKDDAILAIRAVAGPS